VKARTDLRGRLRRPGLWLALVTCIGLAGVVGGRYARRVSPGPLSAVHGRDPDLDGSWDCSSCHGGLGESMVESCLECHAEIGRQLERREGLHGALEPKLAQACARCHGEHHGATFVPVNPRSFALAGLGDLDHFDHAKVGWPLDGGHAGVKCETCHAQARAGELPAGQWRYLGQHQDCRTCHDDPHAGRLGAACADCHGADDWNHAIAVGHEAVLPLIGGHGDVGCRTCHATATPDALESVVRGKRGAGRSCQECHASPHAPAFVERNGHLASLEPARACVTCHAAEHDSFRDPRLTVTPAQHAGTTLWLEKPHGDVACARCHDPAKPAFADRYPGRLVHDCVACHADPHAGQFETSRHGARGCAGCHDYREFEPSTFGRARHAKTALPLAGAHGEAECAQCHRPVADPPAAAITAGVADFHAPDVLRRFRGTESRCEQCHADAHDGAFDRVARELPDEKAGSCSRCHGVVKFDSLAKPFDHGRWTLFALQGAHDQADCESCHPKLPEPDARGRTFERASARAGTIAGCATCHLDPHDGRFDRKGLPAAVAGREGCARCHEETSFRVAPESFDHGAWTGFPLAESHAVACASCHAPLPRADDRGRTTARAAGAGCAACHEDPHVGQFTDDDGALRCTPCHQPTNFSDPWFQHNVHSAFPLDETHRAAACSACHPTETHDGRKVVRYRPIGAECADCHDAPQEPVRRHKRGNG